MKKKDENRLNVINTGLAIILKAQRELRKVKVLLNNETFIIDPILLVNYENNEDFKLSPFVTDYSSTSKSFRLDSVSKMEMLNVRIDSPTFTDFNTLSDADIISRMKFPINAVIMGRVLINLPN